MKTIDRIIIFFLVMYSISACVKPELVEELSSIELTATMEYDAETKTSLSGLENGMYYPLWSAGDEIAVFVDGASEPSKFTLNSGEGTTVASFTGTEEGERYVALYPYDMAESLSDGTITMTLPQTQEYVPDSFGQGSFPMIATGGSDGSLKFMNLCSVLKITLNGNSMIRSITVTANDKDTFLSGPAKIDADFSDIPELVMLEGGSNSVSVKCGALELHGSSDFYLVVPSQTYKGGLKIEVDTYSDIFTVNIESDLIFDRSQIRQIQNSLNVGGDVGEDELQQKIAKEKAALIAFYEALDGDNWYDIWNGTSNEEFENNRWNLHFDEPVYSWYGVGVNENGLVSRLHLPGLNLKGTIPQELFELKELKTLQLNSNAISGELPLGLFELTKLEKLIFHGNSLSGCIPEEIGNLRNLKELDLAGNRFTGTFPESLTELTKLEHLQLNGNLLSGDIPESFYSWDFWKSWWGLNVMGNLYEFEAINLPGPHAVVTCFDGSVIDFEEEYAKHKYTILMQWSCNYSWEHELLLPQLKAIYENYPQNDIQIIGWAVSNVDSSNEAASAYAKDSGMTWNNFYYDLGQYDWVTDSEINEVNKFGTYLGFPANYVTSLTVVDSTGRIVFSDLFDRHIYEEAGYLRKLIDNDFNKDGGDHYKSIDYSQDGVSCALQSATLGNGINVVLLGDGYSDRQIADGTYAADMEYAYNSLFTIEPYKSFRDMFNVSYVNVVSATEGYDYNDTALDCGFGGGTYVYGDNNKCISYAMNVVDDDEVDETLIVVVMNSGRYAGTCHMFYPADASKDYGSGVSVAYFPKGTDEDMFAQLLHHEANGHGFAKLADEYAYEDMGEIPSSVADDHRRQQNDWGWWKNVDFTSDVTQVRWANFIEDERYANEGLGAYEGGLTYWIGVWRPTQTSIMVDNTGVFNAPSREAIYYRIHKLAYGDDWEYDYEKFVEYDAINRAEAASAPQKRRANYVEKQYEPLHPPVVIGKTWRETVK